MQAVSLLLEVSSAKLSPGGFFCFIQLLYFLVELEKTLQVEDLIPTYLANTGCTINKQMKATR